MHRLSRVFRVGRPVAWGVGLVSIVLLGAVAVADGRPAHERRPGPPPPRHEPAPVLVFADPILVDRAAADRLLDGVVLRLGALQGLARPGDDRGGRSGRRAQDHYDAELRALQEDVLRLRELVRQAPPGAPLLYEPVAPEPLGPQPMAEEALGRALRAIDGESFAEAKLSVLERVVRENFVTADQCVRILNAFTFSDGKLKALRLLAPRLIDPENDFTILGAFTFSSDKEEAAKILRHAARDRAGERRR